MKYPLLSFAGSTAVLLFAAQLAVAEPQSGFGLAPSSPMPLEPSQPSSGANPLIPDPVPMTAKPKRERDQGPAADDRTAAAAERVRKRIALRVAMVKAEQDPAIIAKKDLANQSKTYFEQRKYMYEYYNGIFDRVAKIDKSLPKAYLDEERAVYANRYVQGHIDPTVDPATFRKQR